MSQLHIITPVKDSSGTALRTIDSIMHSQTGVDFRYTVYNDFSTPETTARLRTESGNYGFTLVNLSDITQHPSPNYLLMLQTAQKEALSEGAHLLIIESDVIVEKDTVQKMYDYAEKLDRTGIIAAVTVSTSGKINFPYLYAQKYSSGIIETKRRLSFCCTLLTNNYLSAFSFNRLNKERSWYDVFISHKSVELGFKNYLLLSLPVLHLPHSSHPWKLLNYTKPMGYYWNKLTKRRDKK